MNKNWNLNQLFKNTTIEKEKSKIKPLVEKIFSLKNKISENKENLKSYLSSSEELSTIVALISCYLNNQENADLKNSKYTKENQIFGQFLEPFHVKLSFVSNELLNNCEKIIQIIEKNSELNIYKFYFDEILISKKHKISDEKEELMATMSPIIGGSGELFSKLTDADLIFDDIIGENNEIHKMNQGNAAFFLRHSNKNIRKSAYFSFWKAYYNIKNSLACSYFQNIKTTSVLSKIYLYKDSLEEGLFGDRVDRSFYTKLLTEVKNNNHLILKWKKLLTNITKIDDPKPWDWNGPLFEQTQQIFSKEEAKEIIFDALSILGEDYKTKLNYIFDNDLIDWDPKPGKRSGAYSYGVWKGAPFILLNWNGKYIDVSTLIHEIGHSIHTLYSNENQPFIYHDYPIFLAEVASICNEILLINYFIKKSTNKEFKKVILENAIKEFVALIWRQSQFAEFELEVHDKVDKQISLSLEDFESIASSVTSKYYPKLPSETYNDNYQNLWGLYVPHFYSDFYVYKYVTGAIAACALANSILSRDSIKIEKYINFLKSGSSNTPIETLKAAGVDLTKKESFENAFKTFDNFLDELKKLL